MSSTSHWQVELPRLRLHKNVLKHLDRCLEFVQMHGYAKMKDDDPDYTTFCERWKGDIGEGAGRGGNLASSLKKLFLIDGATLSTFAQEILSHWGDQEYVKDAFARKFIIEEGLWAFCHVLSNLSGRTKEEIYNVYKEFYQPDLRDEVITVGHWKDLLVWLGISNDNFEFDDDAFRRRLGISINEFDNLLALDDKSRYLLLSLMRLSKGQKTPFLPAPIKDMYKQLTGRSTAQLNQSYVSHQTKLEEEGYIVTSEAEGAGNAREWTLTDRAIQIYKERILPTLFANPKQSQVLKALSMSYQEIIEKIDNPEPNATTKEKGEILEIFSAKIAFALGLRKIRMNVLDTMERDVLGNITNPFYQRVLIQCKNYSVLRGDGSIAEKTVGMPEIIKEIGIAVSENFDTILFFSRNGFVPGTQADVDKRMQQTGIKIYLFGQDDIDSMIDDEKNLLTIMEEKIRHIEQVMEGTDPVPEGLSRLPDFRDTLREKGWIPPNENTDEHSESETNS